MMKGWHSLKELDVQELSDDDFHAVAYDHFVLEDEVAHRIYAVVRPVLIKPVGIVHDK